MPPQKNLFTVPREEAAIALGISTRTLDRYIRSKKLRAKKLAGKGVFIHAKDLEKLSGGPLKNPAKEKRGRAAYAEAETVEIRDSGEERVFRELYEEVNKELKTKQEKLEAASFRVGQLEAQLKNSIPLLEYKQKEEELEKKKEVMQNENRHFKELYANERIKFLVALIGVATLAIASAALASTFFF